jgi:4-hydroxybenzoate polyprenyltransferase
MAVTATNNARPLCVDLDGTLLATDVLWESLLIFLKNKPWHFLLLPLWLCRGRAFFKRQIAQRVTLSQDNLPYQDDVLSFVKEQQQAGREIVLATASDYLTVRSVAERLGIFSEVLASDGTINLSGRRKRQALEKRFGSKGFDYIGNAEVDLPIWQAAHQAILVHPSPRLLKQARQVSSVSRVFSARPRRIRSLLNALRVHQWVKNVLLFVPLLLAHKVADIERAFYMTCAFLAFSLCASSVYIINDLLDLESDRQHPKKKLRPFAAGQLQIKTGVFLVPLLLAAGFTISLLLLPPLFSAALAFYFVMTTAYSFHLKSLLIIDVLVLAGLYTLRILSGGMAVNVLISPWLLAFSMFFFLNLAFVKRYAELRMTQQRNQTQAQGRSYVVDDLALLRSCGPASGYLSVLVLALYVNSKEVVELYHTPTALWLVGPFILYWITRVWFLAHRGKLEDDPMVFTVKDPVSYAVGAIIVAVMVMASL